MPKNLFTYYGGKTNLIDTILPMIPPHDIYIEPFVGGGSIFFAKQRSKMEIINDLNDNLINLYKVARHPKMRQHLFNLIQQSLYAESTYKKCRTIYNNPTKHKAVPRAFATWYMHNTGYAGKANEGWARSKTAEIDLPKKFNSMKESFLNSAARLENTTIFCENAIDSLNRINNNTVFAYIDPPYHNAKCGHYTLLKKESYFITLLETLQAFNGKFLLSSYESEPLTQFINQNNWNSIQIKQNNSMSGRRTEQKKLNPDGSFYTINNTKSNNIPNKQKGIFKLKTEVLTFNYSPTQNQLF